MYKPKYQYTPTVQYRAKQGKFNVVVSLRQERLSLNTHQPLRDIPGLIRKAYQHANAYAY